MSYNTFQVIRALEEANFGIDKQINVSEKLLVTAPLAVLHLQLGKALQLNNNAERAESCFRYLNFCVNMLYISLIHDNSALSVIS